MPDYNIPTSDTAGSMTLEDLLPGIDFSKYDLTDFQDIIPEFSTALLDITKAQGKENIASAISGGQEAFMQTPSMSAVAGSGGFGGAGGGGRGLIGYETAQRGMFGDVFGAMLGAEKAEMTELERMKSEAGGIWSKISETAPAAEVNENETNVTYESGGGVPTYSTLPTTYSGDIIMVGSKNFFWDESSQTYQSSYKSPPGG